MRETSPSQLQSKLKIRGIELLVHLGWEAAEREQQQVVTVDIDIHFWQLPKACASDNLADTFCYAEFVNLLREQFHSEPYHLIEHLAAEIYALTKKQLPDASIKVNLTKHPHVEGLAGGVTFSLGDGW